MPIILEDTNTSIQNSNSAPTIQLSPKEYSSILTGNGINQGLLKNTVTTLGTLDTTPNHIISLLKAEAHTCNNKSHHVHDDTRNYTILHQDISLCGGYAYAANAIAAPRNLITDHLITFRTVNGDAITYRSRLFLKKLYVHKAVNNNILPALMLMAAPENPMDKTFIVSFDGLYDNRNVVNASNPIEDMYNNITNMVITGVKAKYGNNIMIETDDHVELAKNDASRSMYDLIISELEIIKTPGILKDTLTALSAAGYDFLSYANNILKLINIPFALYQSDVVDVINSRSATEAASLKNANMSLSLADTLNSMKNNTNAVIPELTGKTYKTNAITLTSEQTAAISTDSKITVVAAGAGTGKSSCIMHRLAFMEENGCDMKQTFVLSFTKAAATHIKKNFKDCKSMTIAEFTHNFVNVILDDGDPSHHVNIVSHSDFVQKFKIQLEDLKAANILKPSTINALQNFESNLENMEGCSNFLLDMLDHNMNPEAANIISVLKMMQCTSLELDPIIFHSQLHVLKPNIEHIVIDESQDSNRLEFLTMLKMAMMHDISIYVVGDCAQTLYEFRDADPRILNNLTKLFNTFDLSINHRSTQIILDVANLISDTMTTHKTLLKANNIMQITQQAIDNTITINTFSKVNDPATIKILDDYLEKHLGKNETIAVIARSGLDVVKLYEYLNTRYGATYNVQNITSQRRNDITILSTIGSNLTSLFPKGSIIPNWAAFESKISSENIRINSLAKHNNKYNTNGPTVNKVTLDWLAAKQADGPNIIANLNNSVTYDTEIRKLQMSLLDTQTEKNNTLQRVMDAKNAKLKEKTADIIVCTVHGVKGLEYDHVACFINTESGRTNSSGSDENKRIAYVALTRAKQTECVFCTREKLVKDFEAYRAAQP